MIKEGLKQCNQVLQIMKKGITFFLTLFVAQIVFSQTQSQQDSTTNNLVHEVGYKTSEYGAIPEYTKAGTGSHTLILIPGLGFDASVFKDFIEANKNRFTMYAITIPGFGITTAAPMPDSNVSYGEQSWNKGVVQGLVKLIEKEKLQKPTVVGHFILGTQIALRMAIDYPDKVGSVIILGGAIKFIASMNDTLRDYPLATMCNITDNYTAPIWFKHMKKDFFDDGNFKPSIYSLNEKTGSALWNQVKEVPLPVIIRYSCEYFASDITPELNKIKCPVLVLRATFRKNILNAPLNKNWIQPQFITSWSKATDVNRLIEVIDIPNASTFVWKDNPKETYKRINKFLNQFTNN